MKLLTEGELIDKIGKPSFWQPKRLRDIGTYIAGIPEIDEKIGSNGFLKTLPISNFEKYPQGLGFKIMHNFKFHLAGINNDELESITIEKGGIIDTKEKSVIGRAIIGGFLLGPVGAIIGGASGMNDTILKENDNLIILFKNDGKEEAVLFQIKKGKTNEVFNFFKMHFPGKTILI